MDRTVAAARAGLSRSLGGRRRGGVCRAAETASSARRTVRGADRDRVYLPPRQSRNRFRVSVRPDRYAFQRHGSRSSTLAIL